MNTLITKLPWLARMRSRPIPTAIGVVALVLAATCAVTAWMMSGSISRAADTNEVVNTVGKYRFERPPGWSTTQDGRKTTVTSPDQKTVITFGAGQPGPLPVAGTALFQQVAQTIVGRPLKPGDVRVFPVETTSAGPRRAIIYGGDTINAQHTSISFLVITVENAPINYGIVVSTDNLNAAFQPARRVIDTFRVVA
jgi:hypothetical protein